MTPKLYKFVLALAVIATVWGAYWLIRPGRGLDGPKFHAAGWTWIAPEVDWTELSGQFAVDVRIAPVRGQGRQKISPPLFDAICGGVLTKLPGAPADVHRSAIYRVTVGFMPGVLPDPDNDMSIPVTVIDGGCQPADKGDRYPIRYPGDLQGWNVGWMDQKPGSDERRVIFVRRPESSQELSEFPLKTACEAVAGDPPPGRGPGALSGSLWVEARVTQGLTILNFYNSFSQEFIVTNGKCTAKAPGSGA